jgi:hypothetical protein
MDIAQFYALPGLLLISVSAVSEATRQIKVRVMRDILGAGALSIQRHEGSRSRLRQTRQPLWDFKFEWCLSGLSGGVEKAWNASVCKAMD